LQPGGSIRPLFTAFDHSDRSRSGTGASRSSTSCPGRRAGPRNPRPTRRACAHAQPPPPLRTHAEIFVRGAQERGVVVWYCPSVRQVLLPAEHSRGARPPPPPSRTEWTRLVPPPVLTGHVSSLPGTAPGGALARCVGRGLPEGPRLAPLALLPRRAQGRRRVRDRLRCAAFPACFWSVVSRDAACPIRTG